MNIKNNTWSENLKIHFLNIKKWSMLAIILIFLFSYLRSRKGCFDRRYGSSTTCFGVTKRRSKEDHPPPQIRLEHLSTMMKPKIEGTEPKVILSIGTRAVFYRTQCWNRYFGVHSVVRSSHHRVHFIPSFNIITATVRVPASISLGNPGLQLSSSGQGLILKLLQYHSWLQILKCNGGGTRNISILSFPSSRTNLPITQWYNQTQERSHDGRLRKPGALPRYDTKNAKGKRRRDGKSLRRP